MCTLSEVASVDIFAVTETFLKEEDHSAIEFMTEESGYSWIGRERLGRKEEKGFLSRNPSFGKRRAPVRRKLFGFE